MTRRMTRPLSLRTRLSRVFAGAVLGTLLLQSALVTGVLILDGWWDQRAFPPNHPPEPLFEDVWPVLGAIALTAPFVVFGALVLGRFLAHGALAPMREATQRARAARASTLELSLPLRGTGDEWDELATTLNGLLAEARGTLERIRRFTSDAAHELRTPLTVLIGETEVVLRRERPAEEYRQALRLVADEGRELARLVDVLLTLARADAGLLVTAMQPVDLFLLAQEALRRAQRLLEVQGRTLRLEVTGGHALVRGDLLLLARVLDNLMSNALRHGRHAARIEVLAEPHGVQACVVDDGPGVALAFEPQLFQRFARADPARGEGGVGLGLALSRAIAEAHGGSLDYTRTAAGETRFCLQLPGLGGGGEPGPE